MTQRKPWLREPIRTRAAQAYELFRRTRKYEGESYPRDSRTGVSLFVLAFCGRITLDEMAAEIEGLRVAGG